MSEEDNKSLESSIYQFILRNYVKTPILPYTFQNLEISGRRDIRFVLWEDNLGFAFKEKLALEMTEIIRECVAEKRAVGRLRRMLLECPIYLYMVRLAARLKLLLEEGCIDRNGLYSFGIMLATESREVEEVKIGILILGMYENDITRKIIEILGRHSSFTLYALESSKNFKNWNSFIFGIAQTTEGYGKLAAIYLLNPVLKEQKEWMLRQGPVNTVEPGMAAMLCLEKADMLAEYDKSRIFQGNFKEYSYLLAYSAEKNDIRKFSRSLVILEKYIEAMPKSAGAFIDVAAAAMIVKNMKSVLNEEEQDPVKEQGWTRQIESEIKTECSRMLKQPKWLPVVFSEMGAPHHTTSLIINTLRKLDITPGFEEFIPLIQRDLFDMDLLEFMMAEHAEIYVSQVYDYLLKVLPLKVFEDELLNIREDEFTWEYRPDFWLMYLIREMGKERFLEEDFYVQCLGARFPGVRMEAIKALLGIQSEWSADVPDKLRQAYGREPVAGIAKRLLRLIGSGDSQEEKEKRYIDVSKERCRASAGDVHLMNTFIAGTEACDILVMNSHLEHGDVVCLKREPENKTSPDTIIVTAEDGYVLGAIPASDRIIAAALMDNGEKLYGILTSGTDMLRPEIKIMISRRTEGKGKIIPFFQ
ncbi:HIRAN domain-containing protein [Anaerobium acetethylicum]|uniref:HIRAN domain-containing protein n=1 Tax=Anaerobium acetethylicum TaxID=1619234 RepID=A0A1D3TQ14_9FIRM|nr:HIRAN domain-containing protein [Anaerobium acetethylicum]SCP95623.1 HIRAN domain-containing protein [Anaerobium acetethylicum]